MKGLYLLTAGLLTGLVIPPSTLPHLSIAKSENSGMVENLKDNINPIADRKIFSSSAISPPEFSQSLSPNPVESNYSPLAQLFKSQIISGNQLYDERLAALRVSQMNLSLPDQNMKSSLISIKKAQLTYEDWKNLLAMEANAMAQAQGNNHLGILVGDSLSLWFPREKLPIDRLWLNQGISGDTSGGILKRLSVFGKTKPNIIYVMAGINDLRKGSTDESLLRNHRQIIRKLRQVHPETIIFIQSILPTRLSTIPNTRIRSLNHQLLLIARQERVYYLNLYDWFADFQGNLREDLTTDGLHLSREGYEVWQSALYQVEYKLDASGITKSQ